MIGTIFIFIGAGLLGLAVGYAAGLSKTKGTTKRAVTLLGGLAGGGGVISWATSKNTIGLFIIGLSLGFIIGLTTGIYTREILSQAGIDFTAFYMRK